MSVTFTPTAGGARLGDPDGGQQRARQPADRGPVRYRDHSTTNLALGQPATASSIYQSYVPSNVTDGNTSTYWESTDGAAYPQTITVEPGLGRSRSGRSPWTCRRRPRGPPGRETLSVLGSTNGSPFSQIVGSAGYTFNPSTGNTVTISLPSGTSAQYVQLSFTGNTGWTAAQLSEFEIFPGSGERLRHRR